MCFRWNKRIAAAALMALSTVVVNPMIAMAGKKTVGPNVCAECHKDEAEAWKGTHHFKTFRGMPRSKEARKIAKKLKIKRIKAEKLCLGCHFTQELVRNKPRVTAGISCESCHGPGRDWEKTHADFSGKKSKDQESKAEAKRRWQLSEKSGMIRPQALYKLAKNCYSCHVVPNETLVNVGGHAAGSPFELLSWSQGEVRHNLWYSKGKKNPLASAKRKRMLYVVGIAVEIETALRAVGVATKKKDYAIRMAHRADQARKKMLAIATALNNVPEARKIVQYSHSAGLKLNNNKALRAAADKVAKETKNLVTRYDGSTFAAVDKLLPSASKYRGKPAK